MRYVFPYLLSVDGYCLLKDMWVQSLSPLNNGTREYNECLHRNRSVLQQLSRKSVNSLSHLLKKNANFLLLYK